MAVESAPDFQTSAALPPVLGPPLPALRRAVRLRRDERRRRTRPARRTATTSSRRSTGSRTSTSTSRTATRIATCSSSRSTGRSSATAGRSGSTRPTARIHEVICFLAPGVATARDRPGDARRRSRSARSAGRSRARPATARRYSRPTRSATPARTRCSRRRATSRSATATRWSARTSTRCRTRRCPTASRSGRSATSTSGAICEATIEAFRDHWGFTRADRARLRAVPDRTARVGSTLWRIAWDGDQVAGQVRGFINARRERAVRPEARLGREHHRPAAVA